MAELAKGMRAGRLPGSALLTPLSTPEGIADSFRSAGLTIDESCPCMALDLDAFCPDAASGTVEIRRVYCAEDVSSWAGIVNAGLFGCELFSPQQYLDFFHVEGIAMYLAAVDGVPASACMTVHGGATASLECVATLETHRRRGLGRAVVSKALNDLKQMGLKSVTLRSEPMAIGLYRALGFQEYCKRTTASL